jgi:hypothetical protein
MICDYPLGFLYLYFGKISILSLIYYHFSSFSPKQVIFINWVTDVSNISCLDSHAPINFMVIKLVAVSPCQQILINALNINL